MLGNGRSSHPPRILVANDQEWALRSLESILAPRGYAVLRAYTARQAVELALSGQPDTIILDSRMPEVSGIEICRKLTTDPQVGPSTPIIVVASGAAGREERLAALQAGAWEYCTQPLDAEVLLLKVGTYVRAKHAADRARGRDCSMRRVGCTASAGWLGAPARSAPMRDAAATRWRASPSRRTRIRSRSASG
jgi:CheY-like chemotaxis protein